MTTTTGTAPPIVRELVDVAQDGIRALLCLMGEDPKRPGLVDTPSRVVLIRGDHSCMSLRGSRTVGAQMETADLRGLLDRDPFRSLFLDATRSRR
jgi:GTP cyclohydrolase I